MGPGVARAGIAETGTATYDLSLTGFDTAELDELLRSEPAIVDTAEAASPAPEAPVSQVGDLWRLGPHRLLFAYFFAAGGCQSSILLPSES
jgi:hypothetical protein